MKKIKLAISGRPNVGKSTLFNRLNHGRIAIVDDYSGVTRDRLYGETEWLGHHFTLIDSGGIGEGSDDPLHQIVTENAILAVKEADCVILIVDAREGVTSADREVALELRKLQKKVIVACNKIDNPNLDYLLAAGYGLGFDNVVGISAISAYGIGDLMDAVLQMMELPMPEKKRSGKRKDWDKPLSETEAQAMEYEKQLSERRKFYRAPEIVMSSDDFPDADDDYAGAGLEKMQERWQEYYKNLEETQIEFENTRTVDFENDPITFALVGKPNAGKSSLTNYLVGEFRALVSEVPGTTRDTVYTSLDYKGREFKIFDTAGIKRIKKMNEDVDFYSFVRARGSLQRSEVVLLIIDAAQGITELDKAICKRIASEGKAVVIVVNKWDLSPEQTRLKVEYSKALREDLNKLQWAQVVYTSALERWGADELFKAIIAAWKSFHKRVEPAALKEVIFEIVDLNAPPVRKNSPFVVHDVKQIGIRPPTFLFDVNREDVIHFSYEKYIENQIRKHFGFEGTAIRFVFAPRKTSRSNPTRRTRRR